jgi:hypothetical protein
LQDIVDIAALQHGPNNILHDLGFALIQAGKIKQAEKVFRTSWLKARNERISLHALLFSGIVFMIVRRLFSSISIVSIVIYLLQIPIISML